MPETHCPGMRGQLTIRHIFEDGRAKPIGVEVRSLEYPDRAQICYFDNYKNRESCK